MVPAAAVIYTPNAPNPIQTFSLTNRSVQGVVQDNEALAIEDAEPLTLEVGVGFAFTRLAGADFDPTAPTDVILAASPLSESLSYHGTNRAGLLLDLGGNAADVGGEAPGEGPPAIEVSILPDPEEVCLKGCCLGCQVCCLAV